MNINKVQSGFYLLSDNSDAFIARFALATMARKTLDIQYYIMHNDASGQHLAYAILSAADRGVNVRILLDDINIGGRDSALKMLSQHENIEIRVFNPLKNRGLLRTIELLLHSNRAGRRMHNKAFIADDRAAIIGGRNIGDEYFDYRKNISMVDLDALTVGPVVSDISASFCSFWQSQFVTDAEDLSKVTVLKSQLKGMRTRLKDKWSLARNTDHYKSLQKSDLIQKIINRNIPFIWAECEVFFDQPEKIQNHVADAESHLSTSVREYTRRATKRLLITTPYFIPGKKGMQWLTEKCNNGIDIKVLTNSLSTTDVIAVHAGYRRYRKKLAEHGVKLFELKRDALTLREKTRNFIKGSTRLSLHAKYMIIDHQYLFIGSANFDPRSNRHNTEIGVMINSDELTQQANNIYERATSKENSYSISIENKNGRLNWITQEDDVTVIYSDEPKASLRRRVIVFVASLLPIEELL